MKPKISSELTREQFEAEMAFAPRKYFFATMEEFMRNMEKRSAFVKTLEAYAKLSGIFTVSDHFRNDFLARND